jgi:hypothetical protein
MREQPYFGIDGIGKSLMLHVEVPYQLHYEFSRVAGNGSGIWQKPNQRQYLLETRDIESEGRAGWM